MRSNFAECNAKMYINTINGIPDRWSLYADNEDREYHFAIHSNEQGQRKATLISMRIKDKYYIEKTLLEAYQIGL